MGEMNHCPKHGNGYGSCVACAIEGDIRSKRAYEDGLLEQIQSLTARLAESEARESRYRKALEWAKGIIGGLCERLHEEGIQVDENKCWDPALADPAPSAQCQADRWKRSVEELGARIPIGTPVKVRRDNGDILETVTRSKPWLLGDHWVVLVRGISGCYLLDRVDPRPEAPSEGKPSEGKDGA